MLVFYKTKHTPLRYGSNEKQILKFSVEHNRYFQSNALATRRIESMLLSTDNVTVFFRLLESV